MTPYGMFVKLGLDPLVEDFVDDAAPDGRSVSFNKWGGVTRPTTVYHVYSDDGEIEFRVTVERERKR